MQIEQWDWPTLFFRDRRLLSLAICLIIVSGLGAFLVLPRMEDPELTPRAAVINTIYPGASAERVETSVTDKIEKSVQEVEEVNRLRSVSRDGISTITVELKDSVLRHQADTVWSRIRNKLSDAVPSLPADAEPPEIDVLKTTAYALIVALKWDLDSDPNYAILRRHAEELDDRLRAVDGTKEVDIYGSPDEEILITLRQDELTQRQLSVHDVADQLRASDAKVAAGLQRGVKSDLMLEVGSQLDSLARIRRTPIQFSASSQSVALGDIAEVRRSIRSPHNTHAVVDGKSAVVVAALAVSSKRVDTWFRNARQVLAEFDQSLPEGVCQDVRFEQDTYVRGRLTTLSHNLLLGAIAVVAVVGIMMGWRSAIVVGLTLPLASLMVLSGLKFLGIPMHQMSITGLIIALGLLIDNAIVIVDEVNQKLRSGETHLAAVRHSVQHLAVPLLGSTITTALSFAPIAIMPGPAGEFVSSIAVSVLLAIFSSFLLAMTITPSIFAVLERNFDKPRRSGESWLRNGIHSRFVTSCYSALLGWLYRRPAVGVLASLVLPLMGFGLATRLAEQFFPPADRDQLNVQLELPESTSLSHTAVVAEAARQLILADEQVVGVDWYLGESAPLSTTICCPRAAVSRSMGKLW